MKAVVSEYDPKTGLKTAKVSFGKDDCYSLDHTLSLIIVEALKEFKKKGGAWSLLGR